MATVYERDGDGNVLNPPINQDMERRLYEAAQRADQALINEIQDEYHKWRDERVQHEESREDDRGPEVKLTAAPPSTGNAVQGAPQNIVIPTEEASGPVDTAPVVTATDGPKVETFPPGMTGEDIDRLGAAIAKAQAEMNAGNVPADEVQAATDTGQGLPAHDMADVPPPAPPSDTADTNTGNEGGN